MAVKDINTTNPNVYDQQMNRLFGNWAALVGDSSSPTEGSTFRVSAASVANDLDVLINTDLSAITDATILIDNDCTLSANATVKSTWKLVNLPGAVISGTGSPTLTINGSLDATGKIFDSTITVAGLPLIDYTKPEWFGVVNDGDGAGGGTDNASDIQRMFDSTGFNDVIVFSAGQFQIDSSVTMPRDCSLFGAGAKNTVIEYTAATGDGLILDNPRVQNIARIKIHAINDSTGCGISSPSTGGGGSDIDIRLYEIEGFLKGISIPFGVNVYVGPGRLLGQGKAVAGGYGCQLGHLTDAGIVVNVGTFDRVYSSLYETNFFSRGTTHLMTSIVSENCINAITVASRLAVSGGSWIQGDTTLFNFLAGGWKVTEAGNLLYNSSNVEQDWSSAMIVRNGGSFGTTQGKVSSGEQYHLTVDSATGDVAYNLYQQTTLRSFLKYQNGVGTVLDSDASIYLAPGNTNALQVNSSGDTLPFGRICPETVDTFADLDATPSVSGNNVFRTFTNTLTITDLDDGKDGQVVTIISKAAITFDTTGTNLTGSSVDLVTAAGDVTQWVSDGGTTWRLMGFVDASADNSGGA